MRHLKYCLVAFDFVLAAQASAQDSYRLVESFAKDATYHVQCQVEINGILSLPPNAKEPTPKALKVTGRSSIKYDERILHVSADHKSDRTYRYYRQLEFERKVGDDEQTSKLRTEVHRLVILRHNQYEVPFSPSGPLTWGEIELVRTDVFAPALAGLFPDKSVRVGDRWKATDIAIQELTDVERIEEADLICTFDKVTTLLGRRMAHVNFEGKVKGVGEDGNARHTLRGAYQFDLDANFLTQINVKGSHDLLDKSGKTTGTIEGAFVMTRSPTPLTKEVGVDAMRGMILEPNSENTLLLFEHPQVGARFTYPRNWRIAGFNDKQIGIDENRGSGVLITLSPANATPTGPQFRLETLQFLAKQQAKVLREEKMRTVGSLEAFGFEADLAKTRVFLDYYVARQGNQGATLAARILPADAANVQRDVERMAKSLQFRSK